MGEYGPEYGAVRGNLPDVIADPEATKYFVSTAIAYTNGLPHVGHMYEFLSADVIARYHRVFGHNTYFLTGSDEHGQKVANSAAAAFKTPIEHCDVYVEGFKDLCRRLCVTYSRFIRTTDDDHITTSQKLWSICAAKDDIYLNNYEGWYNEREEAFVPDNEAELSGFKDADGIPYKKVTEESYFFKMSRFTDQLIQHIETNHEFIQPRDKRQEILNRLRNEGLKDLSISRTSFDWGIPVPEGFDKRHVMYVWFDALTNYLSGVRFFEPGHELADFWPASHHIIGKDIIWFHCVIWPCILLSAEIPLPKSIFSHGFVYAADGRKMSKTLGNTVDPLEVLENFPADTVRYYAISSVSYGADVNFNRENIVRCHNNELADVLGNLVHRVVELCKKYCDSKIPDVPHDSAFPLPFDLATLVYGKSVEGQDDVVGMIALLENNVIRDFETKAVRDISQLNLREILLKAMDAVREINKYLTTAEPWKMKGVGDEVRRKAIVRTTLEALYAVFHFLAPVIPIAAGAFFERVSTGPISIRRLKPDLYNLIPGTPVSSGDVLFKKIDDEAASPTAGGGGGGGGGGGAPTSSKSSLSNPISKAPPAAKATPVEIPSVLTVNQLDLRVGRITSCKKHETADKLYCETIDVGEKEDRSIASGLVPHYALEEMQDRLVVVVCNLKPRKMQGFASNGMVLCAVKKLEDGSEIVEFVEVPAGAIPGDRIVGEGVASAPALSANQVDKNKVTDAVFPGFSADSDGVATWSEHKLVIEGKEGFCFAKTVRNGILR